MKLRIHPIYVFALTLLSTLIFSATAVAAPNPNQFALSINNLSNGTVGVDGQNYPIVTFNPGFTIAETNPLIEFASVRLLINNNLKNDWTGLERESNFNPSSYLWDLCRDNSGEPSGRGYSIDKTFNIALNGYMRGELTVYPLVSSTIKVKGNYTCGEQGPDNIYLSFTKGSSTANNTFTLSSDMSDMDLANYDLYLYQTPPGGVADVKNKFTGNSVTWNSSGSAPGSHTFIVRGTTTNPAYTSNIESDPLSVVVGQNGAIDSSSGGLDTNPNNTEHPGGSSGTIQPIKFELPSLDKLKGPDGKPLVGNALVSALFDVIISLIITIVSMFAGVAFIYSGIAYALSFGDPAKAEKAKKNLMWASIGIAVLSLAVVIINIVSRLANAIR